MIQLKHPAVIVAISTLLCAALLISIPALQRAIDALARLAATIARSWIRSLVVVFIVALTVAIIPTLVFGLPIPNVHDEHAYLLQGDTFAHFRLTNPPHPMAIFLETFHVIQDPSYAAKFPVGQGMVLAVGFWLGLPVIGVWLSGAAACTVIAWMLRAFVPPRWALIGGLLCAIHPLVAWWNQSYWGGNVAMLGGALLVGAAARARRDRAKSPRLSRGLVVGVGLAILANSRPLEGFLLSLFVIAWSARSLMRLIIAIAAVVVPVALFMGYYNWRVTKNAFTMPYIVHAQQYMVAPLLFGQSTRPVPQYHHQVFADFYAGTELLEYQHQLPWSRFPIAIAMKWMTLARYFFEPAMLALPMLALLFDRRRRNRTARLALLIFLILPTVHMFITPWLRAAYMAPLMSVFFVAIVSGLRELSRWRYGNVLVFVTIFATLAANVAWSENLRDLSHNWVAIERQRVIRDLQREPGKHLVIVHYGPNHVPTSEFVYNAADIDGSRIVFARSMGNDKDRELCEYFNDRKAWDLSFDDKNPPRRYPHNNGF
jgi:hypothetical protein